MFNTHPILRAHARNPSTRQPIAVIGGGDSAMEEATFLTKYGSHVYIVHRRDAFRASKVMQKRVLDNPKITVLWDSAVEEAYGNERVRNGWWAARATRAGAFRLFVERRRR